MIFTANRDVIYYNSMSKTEGMYMIVTAEETQNHYTQWQYDRANIEI